MMEPVDAYGPNFTKGCFEIEWRRSGDVPYREWSQIDAASPDEALAVLMDGDSGYGRVGRVVSVRERPVIRH